MRHLRRVLPFVILFLTIAPLTAQEPGVVHGLVVGGDGAPRMAAAVSVRRTEDDRVVSGKLTGRDGRFRIEGVAAGTYRVQVTLIGHEPVTRDGVEVAAGERVDLGSITLEQAAIRLEGVVARAERPVMQVLADRTVYATREMPVVQGGTATDALRTIPELEVDGNGKVTTRGATPRIHINGRPAPMQGEALDNYLQNLPADRIERIEVIPNPSARYEAEGQGGIVNIVMRADAGLGLSGSVGLNAGTSQQRGGNARLNYQMGRWTLFGGAAASTSDRRSTTYDFRENRVSDPVTLIQQDGSSLGGSLFTSGDFTAEFKATPKGTLWLETRGYRSGNEQSGTTAYQHMLLDRSPTELYDRASQNEFAFGSVQGSAGYRHVMEANRREYSVEGRTSLNLQENDMLARKLPRGVPVGSETLELWSSSGGEDQAESSVRADVMRPWGPTGKLEVGYRGTTRLTDADRTLEVTLPGGAPLARSDNSFEHRETTHSVYLTADRKVGKVSAQFGLRAEHAATSFHLPQLAERYDNDYSALFPSANLAYELREGHTLRGSYSRRQDRPWPWVLNPINSSTDPLNRWMGNPYLEPRYTHSFNVESVWSGSRLTFRLSPYLRQTVNSWDQVKTVDAQGVSTVTWSNIASIRTYGVSTSTNLRQVGRLGGFVSFSGYREERDASNISSSFSGSSWRWSSNTNLTYRVSSTMNAQGMFNYWPARDIPQGRVSAMVHSNLGLRQQVMNRKGSVNLSVMDPFGLMKYEFETRDANHVQTGRSTWGMRRAVVSFSYNFGRPPQSARRQRQEEQQAQPDQAGQIR